MDFCRFVLNFWLIGVKKSYQKCISRQNTRRLSVEVQEDHLLSPSAHGRAAAFGLFLGFRVASSSETQGAVNQSRRSMCSSPNLLLLLPSAFIQLEDKEDPSAEFRQSNICSVEIYSKVFIEELSLRRTHKTRFLMFFSFLSVVRELRREILSLFLFPVMKRRITKSLYGEVVKRFTID